MKAIYNDNKVEYYRNPTAYEIRFGEVAIHYKDFSSYELASRRGYKLITFYI